MQTKPTRLCFYTVTDDYGFSPNPFHGYCTLAACTPNHQGIKLHEGDWIVGHATVDRSSGLIYAMKLSENPLGFDEYFHDSRFGAKRPRFDRGWQEACGDNIYYRVGELWRQVETLFHDVRTDQNIPTFMEQDTKYARVYAATHFYYFGEYAVPIPAEFERIIRRGRGCKVNEDPEFIAQFAGWLEANFVSGIRGLPRDRIETFTAPAAVTHVAAPPAAQPGGCG